MYVSADHIRTAITPAQAVSAVLETAPLIDQENVPPTLHSPLEHGQFLMKPGEVGGYVVLKILTETPGNVECGLPVLNGSCTLYDGTTHQSLAEFDGAALTSVRTAAVSLAGAFYPIRTRRPDGVHLAIFGNGVEAVAHAHAACSVTRVTGADVFVRRVGAASPVIDALAEHGVNAHEVLQGSGEAAAALRSADLVLTCTAASKPLFAAADVKPDAVIVAMGSHTPDARELPGELLSAASVVVESKASALAECGDVVCAIAEGNLSADRLLTLRRLAETRGAGLDPAAPVVFKTSGMGWEDAAVAAAIFRALGGAGENAHGDAQAASAEQSVTMPTEHSAGVPVGHVVGTASPADIAEWVALVESAYRGDASRAGWTTEADLLGGQRLDAAMAAEVLADPATTVLMLRDGAGTLVGNVQLTREDAHTAYFGLFAVSPVRQGDGLGTALMRLAQDWARDAWGATRMRMTVIDKRADLIAYYERKGWALTGRSEPFPYGHPEFGDPKSDDLAFVELVTEL